MQKNKWLIRAGLGLQLRLKYMLVLQQCASKPLGLDAWPLWIFSSFYAWLQVNTCKQHYSKLCVWLLNYTPEHWLEGNTSCLALLVKEKTYKGKTVKKIWCQIWCHWFAEVKNRNVLQRLSMNPLCSDDENVNLKQIYIYLNKRQIVQM